MSEYEKSLDIAIESVKMDKTIELKIRERVVQQLYRIKDQLFHADEICELVYPPGTEL